MKILWVIIVCLLSLSVKAQRFEAETDAKTVLQGSSFRVKFNLYNAEGSRFQAPDFGSLQLLSGPSRSFQTSIVNGRKSSNQGYVFELLSNKPGIYTIPPARITVDGRELRTQALSIEVVKSSPGSSGQSEIFVIASIDKQNLYVGEQCQLMYKLYTRVNIESVEAASTPSLDAFHHLPVNMLYNPVQREVYKGREYMTRILSKTSLYPIREGKLTVDPMVYRVVQGDNDPFGFGIGSFFRQQIENISTNALTIQVNPLPPNAPVNFSGAVGQMDMTVEHPDKQYALQDAILLKIQIRGNANFNGLKGKFIEMDSTYEISEGKADAPLKITDEPEMNHSCQFEFLLVPKKSGILKLQPQLIYFEPKLGKYQTIKDSFFIQIYDRGISEQDRNAKIEIGLKPLVPPSIWSKPLEENPLTLFFCMIPLVVSGSLYFNKSQKLKSKVQIKNNLEDPVTLLEQEFLKRVTKWSHETNLGMSRQRAIELLRSHPEDPMAAALLEWFFQLEQAKYSGLLDETAVEHLHQKLHNINP